MADKYINPTGLQTIKTWIEGKFALNSDVTALETVVNGLIGAEPNVIEVVQKNGVALTVTNKTVNVTVPTQTSDLTNNSNFVSDASYVHTDNNFTTTLKDKLDGIAAGAEVNVNADWNASSGDAQILNKPTAVSAFTNDSGYQTAAQVESAINTKIASAYIYKGSVATYNDLPVSGNTTGDVYDVQSTGINYAWNGTAWDALGAYVDTSLYWAKADLVAMTTSEINAILTPSS